MANRLNRPIPRPIGHCCCGPCSVRLTCDVTEVAGVAEEGFFGLCCPCIPRYACVDLIDSYGSGCLGGAVDPVTVEWDEDTNRYAVSFDLGAGRIVDIAIGFENGPGEPSTTDPMTCYVVLASNCMNYRRQGLIGQGPMEDTRIFQRLYDTGYDDPDRRSVCRGLDVEFEVDLARCAADGEYGYGEGEGCPVTVRIRPADFVSREQKFTGVWDGYNYCHYRRVCITYVKDDERIDNYVCIDDDYGFWQTEFEDIDGQPLTVTITREDDTSTVLRMQTDRPDIPDGDPVAAECPDMAAEWDLGYGASIRIRGDQSADCRDCRCFPEFLCVQLWNDFDEPIWQGTLTYDEYSDSYTGTLEDVSLGEADPVDVTLLLRCDECTGQTHMEWARNGEWQRVAVECPLTSGAFAVVEENQSTTVLAFDPKDCAGCFSLGQLVECEACDAGVSVPRTLYVTAVPVGNAAAQTCFEGNVTTLLWAFHPGGGFWSGQLRCPGCPECEIESPFQCRKNITFNCSADPYAPFTLTFNGVPVLLMSHSCFPLMAEFGLLLNSLELGNLPCTDRPHLGAEDPDMTFKLVVTA